jgi:1-acylglycerone phosphate reductase
MAGVERPSKGQKIAVVTGVGVGGIGGSLATELHREGYFVVCGARRPEAIESLLKPGMVSAALDVKSTEAVAELAKMVASLSDDGRLDLLVNNAGTATHLPALDVDVDGTVRDMYDVNVLGPMRMVKAFGALLIKARGTVVNVGSIAPIMPLSFSAAYGGTKAALHAYGDILRLELSPFG